MSTDDILNGARQALEGVPDGPWTVEREDGEPIIHEAHHYDSSDEWYDVDGHNGGWKAHCEDLPTAEFIAASRSLVPELVAELSRLRARETQLRAAIRPLAEAWADPDAGDDILAVLDAEDQP